VYIYIYIYIVLLSLEREKEREKDDSPVLQLLLIWGNGSKCLLIEPLSGAALWYNLPFHIKGSQSLSVM